LTFVAARHPEKLAERSQLFVFWKQVCRPRQKSVGTNASRFQRHRYRDRKRASQPNPVGIICEAWATLIDINRANAALATQIPPQNGLLVTQRKDEAAALCDVLCKRERCLGSLLNARYLAFSIIKHAISFCHNLHGPGDNFLRRTLGFSNNIASRGARLNYKALSFIEP
jgi:hypothetical protein